MNFHTNALAFKGGLYAAGNASLFGAAALQPMVLALAIPWLFQKPRTINRWVMPLVFRHIQCTNPDCRYIIPLDQRWVIEKYTHNCAESVWRFHAKGVEIGSIECPKCTTTLYIQKWAACRLVHAKIEGNAFTLAPTEKRLTTLSYLKQLFAKAPVEAEYPAYPIGTNSDASPTTGLKLWSFMRRIPIANHVEIQPDTYFRHKAVFGGTGMGKSSQMLDEIEWCMNNGFGLTVVEPNGKLIRDAIARVPEDRVEDVYLIRAGDTSCPFQMNPLVATDAMSEWNTIGELLRTLKSVSDSWGTDISYNLEKAMRSASYIGGSLRDAYDLLALPSARDRIVPLLEDERLQLFWSMWKDMRHKARVPTIRKLESMMEHPILGKMLGARQSNFDPAEVVRKSKIVFVDLSSRSDTLEVIENLGTVIIGKTRSEAFKQTEDEAVPHFMFIDEARRFMYEGMDFGTIFSEARKKKLALTIATQHPHQLDEEILEEIYTNVGSIVSFAVDLKYAKHLADRMTDVAPEEIMNQDVQHCVAKIHRKSYRIRTNTLRKPKEDFTREVEQRMAALNELTEAEEFSSALSPPLRTTNQSSALVPEGVQ